MHQSERLAALRRVRILAELPDLRLEQLAGTCKWQNYDAGEQILSYDDPSTDVLFLAAGKVRVIIYSASGKAVVFTDLRPGAMFGEIAAIDRLARSAGVEAIEPSTIASLAASQFENLLLREPAVTVATLRHVTAEVRRLSERVVEFSTLAVQNRIHAELLRLAAAGVSQPQGQVLLSPAPSLADIADRISTHREAVSRTEPARLHRSVAPRRWRPQDHRRRPARTARPRSQGRLAPPRNSQRSSQRPRPTKAVGHLPQPGGHRNDASQPELKFALCSRAGVAPAFPLPSWGRRADRGHRALQACRFRPPSGRPLGSKLFSQALGKANDPRPDPRAWFSPQRWGQAMRTGKRIIVAGILAAATCGLLIASFAAASVSAPRAGVPAVEATVSPVAMMMQAPRNLTVQQYDSY